MSQTPTFASDKEFAAIYNDRDMFPTLQDVAEELGIALQTVKNRASRMRARFEAEGEGVQVIFRGRSNNDSPTYETNHSFYEHWTEDDCIKELRRVADLEPDKFLSRTHFRNNTIVTDSTWNRYFGTFQEFKRAAGLDLNRHQSLHEKKIASHSSIDHYREANERHEWAEQYKRDNGKRFKTILLCSDLHDVEIDPFYLRMLVEATRRAQPDIVSFVGDVFDLAEFGRFNVDPRGWDVVGRIKYVHEHIYRPIREAAPDAQIDHIEGNHEHRLLRHMMDATPALQAVLADLHGWSIRKLLGLDEFEINYVSKADLGARSKGDVKNEVGKNYKIYFDCLLAHHFPHAKNWGLAGVNGHHHQHLVTNHFDPRLGPYEWHQLGGGHKRKASYCEGEKWSNGFVLAHVDTQNGRTVFEYVDIADHAVLGGRWYHREPSEVVS